MDSGGAGKTERATSRGRGGRLGAIRAAALDTAAALTGVRAAGRDADTARALGADSGADSGATTGAGKASTERSPRDATKTPAATRAIPPSAAKYGAPEGFAG